MDKLEQVKSMLKELSPEEMEELKSLMVEDKTEDTPKEETEQISAPLEESVEQTSEETSEEVAPTKETSESTEECSETTQGETTEELPTEENVATSDNLTADDGSEIPIDNQSIIDGLNAKIAALEAENSSLKSRYEGPFGFSAKPTAPGKVNPLYDDAIDNVRFHK